jgi:hypothetical protein
MCHVFGTHKEVDKVNRLNSKSRGGTDAGIFWGTERKSVSEKVRECGLDSTG